MRRSLRVVKRCRTCRIEKPLDEFTTHDSTRDGLRNECKTCARARSFAWRHGMTDAERLAAGSCCRICGATERLRLDHDHAHCGHDRSCPDCRRGVLCDQCNKALGLFRDSPDLLLAAVVYLRSWR